MKLLRRLVTYITLASLIFVSCDSNILETLTEDNATTVTGITVSPYTYKLSAGNSLALSATVEGNNSPEQSVTWSIAGKKSSATYITEKGVLVLGADENAKSIIVTATATADSSKTGDAHITIVEPTVTSVSVTPNATTLSLKSSLQFTADIVGTNDPIRTVKWTIKDNTSTATKINANGVVTIGADEAAATITVTATSAFDTTKSATATITVLQYTITSITVSPTTTSLLLGTSTTFSATIEGTDLTVDAKTPVWSVTGASSAATTIDSTTGELTVGADETSATLMVYAASKGDPSKKANASVTVLLPVVKSVTIYSPTQLLELKSTNTFTAIVNGDYSPAQTVTWSMTGNNRKSTKIDAATGVLTVASTEDASSLTIKATSTVNTAISGSITVAVHVKETPAGQDNSHITSVDITPLVSYMHNSQQQDFSATVSGSGSGTPSQEVIWSIEGQQSANTTIDDTGNLSVAADESSKAIYITAVSAYNEEIVGKAAVSLTLPTVTSVTITFSADKAGRDGDTQCFASVSGTNDPPQFVSWSMTGNGKEGTYINKNTGVLTVASDETALSLSINAIALFDITKFTTSTIEVIQPDVTNVTVSAASTSVRIENATQCTATVTGNYNPDTSVTWTVENNTSANTTITSAGIITIGKDENANTLTVRATSVVTTTVSGTVEITVLHPKLQYLYVTCALNRDLYQTSYYKIKPGYKYWIEWEKDEQYYPDNSGVDWWEVTGTTSANTTWEKDGWLSLIVAADEAAPNGITITAHNSTWGVSGSKTFTLDVPDITDVTITAEEPEYPLVSNLIYHGSKHFSATVNYAKNFTSNNKDVTWSLVGDSGEFVIDQNGYLYQKSKSDNNSECYQITVRASAKAWAAKYADMKIDVYKKISASGDSLSSALSSTISTMSNGVPSCILFYNKDVTQKELAKFNGILSNTAHKNKIIYLAFIGCNPPKVIPSNCFKGLTNLTGVYFDKDEDGSSLATIGENAFDGATNFKYAYFSDTLHRIDDYAFRNTNIDYLKLIGDITSMGSYVFQGCPKTMTLWLSYNTKNKYMDSTKYFKSDWKGDWKGKVI